MTLIDRTWCSCHRPGHMPMDHVKTCQFDFFPKERHLPQLFNHPKCVSHRCVPNEFIPCGVTPSCFYSFLHRISCRFITHEPMQDKCCKFAGFVNLMKIPVAACFCRCEYHPQRMSFFFSHTTDISMSNKGNLERTLDTEPSPARVERAWNAFCNCISGRAKNIIKRWTI